MSLVRDAALSLEVTHPFTSEVANPRQMTPFSYHESTAVLAEDPVFSGGPMTGAMVPEVAFGSGFLTDKLGTGLTVLCFCPEFAAQLEKRNTELRIALTVLVLPQSLCNRFSAVETSAYLIRPDFYIAARWYQAKVENVIAGIQQVVFKQEASDEPC